MPSRPEAATGAPFDSIVQAVREHTHVLLGRTISYSAEDWAASTRLPGWTRSHVAAHLVAGAHGLVRVCRGLAEGRQVRMYESDSDRTRDVELGALSDGLSLQIDLDTSASRLQEEFPALVGDEREVTLRAGLTIPAWAIPVARLHEVALHSFDLQLDDTRVDMAPDVARLLLMGTVTYIGDRQDLPSAHLVADEGLDAHIGAPMPDPPVVSGPACDIWLWLNRGVVTDLLHGAPPPIAHG